MTDTPDDLHTPRKPGERRSTWELIALLFAATVALVIIVSTVAVGILLQDADDAPLSAILNAIGAASSTLLGALIVIVAGRRHV